MAMLKRDRRRCIMRIELGKRAGCSGDELTVPVRLGIYSGGEVVTPRAENSATGNR